MPAAWVAIASAVVAAAQQQDASSNASKAQQQAADKSIAAQNAQLGLTRGDNAPFLKTGTAANARLSSLLGLAPDKSQFQTGYSQTATPVDPNNFDAQGYLLANPDVAKNAYFSKNPLEHYQTYGKNESRLAFSPIYNTPAMDAAQQPGGTFGSLTKKFDANDLNADPVYNAGLKFGLDRGTEGINSRALANGMYDSGATLKALTQFGTDYGSTKANESFNRYNVSNDNIFNKLSGISGTGQVATGQVAAAGSNAASNISNDITGAGNARAAGIVGGANAWGNAATNANAGYNNYQSNKRLDALLAQKNQNYNSSGTYSPQYSGYSSNGDYAYG